MNVGFTGTQKGMTDKQRDTVEAILKAYAQTGQKLTQVLGADLIAPMVFHHGDCIGADAEAQAIALSLGYQCMAYPAGIKGKRAFTEGNEVVHEPTLPKVRNGEIVANSDVMIATPRGTEGAYPRSGTWATVRMARRAKKLIYIVKPDGFPYEEASE